MIKSKDNFQQLIQESNDSFKGLPPFWNFSHKDLFNGKVRSVGNIKIKTKNS